MARLLVLGAAGALGRYVVRGAVRDGHDTSVLMRDGMRLEEPLRGRVDVHEADIAALPAAELAKLARGKDAVLNAAGTVTDGSTFVSLVDHVALSVESLPATERPVCWFMAGLGILDIGCSSVRGIDLPILAKTYWPHGANLARLASSELEWRLLCPGPMVHADAVGISRLRQSVDKLPVDFPALPSWLPRAAYLPLLARRMPELIVPFADAADLMLANLDRASRFSRRRVGIALPDGMKGAKNKWLAKAGQ